MPGDSTRERLDQLLVKRGLARTRARARDLILRGEVSVAGSLASKSGQLVASDIEIGMDESSSRYVSRGALKLIAALDAFGFDPKGLNALDIGASTGGFTQVLLERGATRVTAVDVGREQLAADLKNDPRVISREGLDARELSGDMLTGETGAIVADVSFISLTKVLPPVLALAAPGCWLIALVKPQFEAGREAVGKGGIVRDEATRKASLKRVEAWISGRRGWTVEGSMESPVKGGDGNQEFLLGAKVRI